MKQKHPIVFCLIAIAIITGQNVFAQHPRTYTQRKSFWFEANLAGNITKDKKWQYQVDYQYRRMADASFIEGGQHNNIFKDPYQQVVRPWIHYWAIPGQVRLSLSPIGYWITWTPPQEGSVYKTPQGNVGKTVFPEFRTCPQVTIVQNFGRVMYSNRFRYEFRWLGTRTASTDGLDDFGLGYSFNPNGSSGSTHSGRFRWQLRVQVPINKPKIEAKTFYINAWNELFIGVSKHVANNKLLNQDRVVGLIGYKLPGAFPIKLEAGITYQTIFAYNINTVPTQPSVNYGSTNVESNTAFTIYAIFDEFDKLFKKKKVEEPK